jgi:hypothetical protein
MGRNRVAVGDVWWTATQGSSCLATLGFGKESRWDSRVAQKGVAAKGRVTGKGGLEQISASPSSALVPAKLLRKKCCPAFAGHRQGKRVADRCWLLVLFRWRRSGCGRRRRGGSHRRRCGRGRRRLKLGNHRRRRRRRGRRQRDGGVMPMAVLGGPHFSRRSLAGWLRRGRERLLRRQSEGLRLRRSASSGRSGLLRSSRRLGKKVSPCRSDDHTAGSG